MRLRELTPIIWTKDLQETADFYTNTLDFKLDNLDLDLGWGHLSKGGVQIMIALPKDEEFETTGFTGSFYIYVNGINELWDNINEQVNVCKPIKDHPYGMREFSIYDNNGYRLQFGQEESD